MNNMMTSLTVYSIYQEKNYWQQNPDQGVKLDFDQKQWLSDRKVLMNLQIQMQ